MDQPTAEEALKRLEPLIGDWTLEAKPPDGPPWPGEARATIEWHDSGAHLVQRSTVDIPEVPDSISIMGCDAANGTYFQLYSDDRGVCRVYEMSIGDGEWKLWREGEPFPQRFTATISDGVGPCAATSFPRRPGGAVRKCTAPCHHAVRARHRRHYARLPPRLVGGRPDTEPSESDRVFRKNTIEKAHHRCAGSTGAGPAATLAVPSILGTSLENRGRVALAEVGGDQEAWDKLET